MVDLLFGGAIYGRACPAKFEGVQELVEADEFDQEVGVEPTLFYGLTVEMRNIR